jgi:tetratricopeptide (TPR) repeat protein
MKKIFLLGMISLSFMISSYAQTDSSSAEKMDPKAAAYYNKAVEAMKTEKYEEAVTQLDSGSAIQKDFRISYLKGQAYNKLGRTEDAITAFNETIQVNPKYDMGYLALGNSHLAAKDYDQAVIDFNKVAEVTTNPDLKKTAMESVQFVTESKAIDFYNKGIEAYKANNYDMAIQNFDKALAINKDYKFHYQKGLALSKLEKTAEAETEFKSALALNDSFDIAYVALGGLEAADKNYDEALKNYEKALSVSTNDNLKASIQDGISRTYIAAGNNLYKEKKYDKSIEYLKKAVASSPSDVAYLSLAKSLIEKKQYSDATSALDSTAQLKKNVTDGAIAYYKGVIQLNKGDDNGASQFFASALTDATYKKAAQSQIDYIKAKKAGAKPKK